MKLKPSMIGIPLGILIFFSIYAKFEDNRTQARTAWDMRNQASSQIQVGMSQAEVIAIVEAVAWRRYVCSHTETSMPDVYIFGSRNLDLTEILLLDYRIENEEVLLDRKSTFDKYMLDSVTFYCEARDIR